VLFTCSRNKLILLTYVRSRCVPFSFRPSWFSLTLMVYPKVRLTSNGIRASACFKPFCIIFSLLDRKILPRVCSQSSHCSTLNVTEVSYLYKTTNSVALSASELYRPSDRRLSTKLVSPGQRNLSPRPYSRFYRPEPLLFLPSSSSIVLTSLSGARSRPTTSQKIW
jgi:hypothetical protein